MSVVLASAGSQCLRVNSSAISGTPCTLAAWVKPDVSSSVATVIDVDDLNNPGTEFFAVRLFKSTYTVQAMVCHGGSATFATSNASYPWSNGQWVHIGGVFTSPTHRTAYCRGVPGTPSTTERNDPAGLNRTTVGVQNSLYFYNGNVAEIAIYNAALSDDDMLQLSKGFSPLLIRPASLVFYAPLTRNNGSGDWIELMDGRQLSEVNSPVVAEQPRIIQPARPLIVPNSHNGNITVLSQYYRKMRVA